MVMLQLFIAHANDTNERQTPKSVVKIVRHQWQPNITFSTLIIDEQDLAVDASFFFLQIDAHTLARSLAHIYFNLATRIVCTRYSKIYFDGNWIAPTN